MMTEDAMWTEKAVGEKLCQLRVGENNLPPLKCSSQPSQTASKDRDLEAKNQHTMRSSLLPNAQLNAIFPAECQPVRPPLLPALSRIHLVELRTSHTPDVPLQNQSCSKRYVSKAGGFAEYASTPSERREPDMAPSVLHDVWSNHRIYSPILLWP